jgi:hypothetical protein
MFNLFLERIVTGFAVILRAYHEYKIRRRRINEQLALEREKRAAAEGTVRDKSRRTIPKLTVNECDSRLDWGLAPALLNSFFSDIDDGSSVGGVAPWKPSLYKVFGSLFAVACVWIALCACYFSIGEGWTYPEAVYFSFIR